MSYFASYREIDSAESVRLLLLGIRALSLSMLGKIGVVAPQRRKTDL